MLLYGVVVVAAVPQATLPIPRVPAPSLERFFLEFADLRIPVIITNYTAPFRDMTRANVLHHCGEVSVPITSAGGSGWAGITRGDSSFTLAEVVEMVQESCDADTESSRSCSADTESAFGDGAIGVFDFSLPRHCASLLDEHFTMPKYLAQDFLQRVPQSVRLQYRDEWPSLFWGRDGNSILKSKSKRKCKYITFFYRNISRCVLQAA